MLANSTVLVYTHMTSNNNSNKTVLDRSTVLANSAELVNTHMKYNKTGLANITVLDRSTG